LKKIIKKIIGNFRYLSKDSSPIRDSIIALIFNNRFNFKSKVEKKGGKTYINDSVFRLRLSSEKRLPIYRFGIYTRLKQLSKDYSLDKVPLHKDSYVINVGSNIGELAILIANRGPNVICIEGDCRNIEALRENTNTFGCEVIKSIIWEKNEKICFESDIKEANSAISFSDQSFKKTQAFTLDTILKSYGLEEIQLIIGDMEGAEPEMLLGAKKILKITKYISLDCGLEREGKSTSNKCKEILLKNNWQIIHSFQSGRYNLLAKNNLFK
tara:strand:- start:844 stop:1650 length:807 start_codon:yes stop_codon:yes gene_type:complete